jgi:hypothetical protein
MGCHATTQGIPSRTGKDIGLCLVCPAHISLLVFDFVLLVGTIGTMPERFVAAVAELVFDGHPYRGLPNEVRLLKGAPR